MAVVTFCHGYFRVTSVEEDGPTPLLLCREFLLSSLDSIVLAIGADERTLKLCECFGRVGSANLLARKSCLESFFVPAATPQALFNLSPVITHF